MKSSLFKKLLGTYLVIIISAITLLSTLLSLLYAGNVLRSKHRELVSAAVKVNQLALEYTRGEKSKESLDSGIDALGFATGAKIYLVRMDKAFLFSKDAGAFAKEMQDSYLPEDLEQILGGQTVYRQNIYSDLFDMPVVFTGVPWKTDTSVQGAILMFAPIEGIVASMMDINLAIWLTGLGFILISAVVIFFASRRISTPIKNVEQAAAKLAAGEAPPDLAVVGNDEIGKLTRSFNLMKHQIEDNEKMRRDFIANVSHDLRTPLTSINGFVEGMRDGLIKPENYGTYLEKIHVETNRLIRLTNEILQLAKLQSGGIGIAKEQLSAAEVIGDAADGVRTLLSAKEMNLVIECGEGVFVSYL
jgi:HAMP domain-containing protein